MAIPVIDLFAGPGGLGEGFSALRRGREPVFKIKLSIEKDSFAHRTLELRAFFRQFADGDAPGAFYDYLAGRISREALFSGCGDAAHAAEREAWHAELGSPHYPHRMVDKRIDAALAGQKRWVLIGGPPCQAYSLVGRARIIGGEDGLQRYDQDKRHLLYRRYLRILAVHAPPVFIMENVKGLLSAARREQRIFSRILRDLEHPLKAVPEARDGRAPDTLAYRLVALGQSSDNLFETYEPEDFVVRMERHGAPQARHRLIILGIRSDAFRAPKLLRQSPTVSTRDAIGDLPKLRSGLSKEPDSAEAWFDALHSANNAGWLRNGRLDSELRQAVRDALGRINDRLDRGHEFVPGTPRPAFASDWFFDPRLGGFCNHSTRGHIRTDLHRYLFASVFARVRMRSPALEDFPSDLLPNHENVHEAIAGSKFNDRFRVQVADRPSTTVVSHISKDGHYYIHYDPAQCRSLTVREAARLQTFPDNYFFEGPRTEQYKQVGNAVPPFVAHQIAEIVAGVLV